MAKNIIEDEFKKAVWEQGFSLEQNVFRILEKDGWNILPNRNFFDSISGLTREFDILAYKAISKFNITFFTVLIIECKFNPHRIVFYARPSKQQLRFPRFYIGDFIKSFISNKEISSFFTETKQFKSFFKDSEQVFGYQTFEKIEKNERNTTTNKIDKKLSFKTRQELSEKSIFGAINTAIQATIYEKKQRDQKLNTANLIMFFPTVVFSGDLYKADLTGKRKGLKKQGIFHYRTGMAFGDEESLDEFDIHICDIVNFNILLKVFNYVYKQFSLSFFKKVKSKK